MGTTNFHQLLAFFSVAVCLTAVTPPTFAISADTVSACAKEAGHRWEPELKSGKLIVEIDLSRALAACEKAVALSRSGPELYRLSRTLAKAGRHSEAFQIANESVEQRYGPAIELVGFYYLTGLAPEVPIDYNRALVLFKESIDLGYAPAAERIGYMYSYGVGVEKNPKEAEKYYKNGVDMGHDLSQLGLGVLYRDNEDLNKSHEDSLALIRLAAEQKNGAALSNLGEAYEWGMGVARDSSIAREHYKASAELNDAAGIENLQRLEYTLSFKSDFDQNEWEIVENSVSTSILSQPPIKKMLGILEVPAVESLRLPFYNNKIRLIRARYSNIMGSAFAYYYLQDDSGLTHLDGTSNPINTFNKKHNLNLHNEILAKHYIWFFGFLLRSELNAPFLTVESILDFHIPKNLSKVELNEIEQLLDPVKCSIANNSKYECYTNIYHKNVLSKTKFSLERNGNLRMIASETLKNNISKRVFAPINEAELSNFLELNSNANHISDKDAQIAQSILSREIEKIEKENDELSKEYKGLDEERKLVESEQRLLAAEIKLTEALVIMAKEGRVKTAYDLLRVAVDAGNPAAQYELSKFYIAGDVVEKDEKKGIQMLRTAAMAGHKDAMMLLGLELRSIWSKGDGESDAIFGEAIKWFNNADLEGVSEARHELAYAHYLLGLNQTVNGDEESAFQSYVKAANSGFDEAQLKVGHSYHYGHGVVQNYGKATEWYRQAARQNHAESQRMLGRMYNDGKGVDKDINQAIVWYKKAADYGNVWALHNLGHLYISGDLDKDYEMAFFWYKKAADLGLDESQYNVGVMYEQGLGVKRNNEQAVNWLKLAAEQGHTRAAERLLEIQ